MTIFDVLTMIGGLAMFLFGMHTMSAALEKRAGGRLKSILGSMTSSTVKGVLLGTAVTIVVQSSSATTVMLVGLVNSGIITLAQSVGVIMGANLGAAGMTWLLSLTGIQGDALWIQLLKPSTFTPILAGIGAFFYLFQKNTKRKDTGLILLSFSFLMFGMETMSGAVTGLRDSESFTQILTLFTQPLLGLLVGIVFTAIIQSSGASIGILQALSLTGSVTYAAAIPIIMGRNIGTCISALLACVGTSKDARRTAIIHLSFNVIAAAVLLPLYGIVRAVFSIPLLTEAANPVGIAIVTMAFKLLALALLMPCSNLLLRLAKRIVPDGKSDSAVALLDERLLATPSVAVSRSRAVTERMANDAVEGIRLAFDQLVAFDEAQAERIRALEDLCDEYEDHLGTYLVRLSGHDMSERDSLEVNMLLHMIGDFERISDHSVNLLESAEEIRDKKIIFSGGAQEDLDTMIQAVAECLQLAVDAFEQNDLHKAVMVEPLEQVVDDLCDELKSRHITRLQRGECTIELGFVLSDLLTNLERISDHCSNIAECQLEISHRDLDLHAYLRQLRDSSSGEFNTFYDYYRAKFALH